MTLAEQFRQEGQEEGWKKGRQEGRQEGRIAGETQLLHRLLQRKFGPLPDWVEQRLKESNIEDLERWSERVFDAVIIDDIFA